MRAVTLLILLAAFMFATGCNNVRRTIEISSDPPGALVWLNGREVGRTPLEVDFIYYGEYDVQLVADGYEPLLTTGKADPPLWDHVPLDFFAEVTPPKKHARILWHYELQPRNDDPQQLLNRARELRARASERSADASNPTEPISTAQDASETPDLE